MFPADKLLISVARGSQPADLIFKNARIINVFTGEIESGSVTVFNGYISGIGDYSNGKSIIELQGKYLAPVPSEFIKHSKES